MYPTTKHPQALHYHGRAQVSSSFRAWSPALTSAPNFVTVEPHKSRTVFFLECVQRNGSSLVTGVAPATHPIRAPHPGLGQVFPVADRERMGSYR